jgi:restriction system protein
MLAQANAYVIANAFPILVCILFGGFTIIAGSGLCSKWLQRRRRRRWSQQFRSIRRLQAMSWLELEALTGEIFREDYDVEGRGGGGPDGGIDLILWTPRILWRVWTLWKRRRKYVVSCKHSRDGTRSIGVRVVREIAGVARREKADGAIVVTTGKFSKDAVSDAMKLSVRLIDGPALLRLAAANRNTRLAPYPSPGARGTRR